MDIFRDGDPVALLSTGWFALETFKGESFRWASNDARLNVAQLRSSGCSVALTLEPGPGVGSKPFDLKILDGAAHELGTWTVQGKQTLSFELPPGEPAVHQLTLHVDGGGKRAIADDRILNFRVFEVAVLPVAGDIIDLKGGLSLGAGWYPIENFNGETFRWAGSEAVIDSRHPQDSGEVRLDVEPGPGVGYEPFTITVSQNGSESSARIEVKGRQRIAIPAPKSETSSKIHLRVERGGKAVPGDPRILNFRAFVLAD